MEDIQTLLNNAKQLTEDGNIKVNNLDTSIVSPQPHRHLHFSVVRPLHLPIILIELYNRRGIYQT